ncbi:hypothetical protein MANI_025218 [Metarhizium anisopliae]|nr:hypothetical protein MANI_025218 [Metarhizium anisopliae]
MAEDSSIAMGVDLGTTNCCVAIMEEGKTEPRVVIHDYDKRTFPSTFSVRGDIWKVGEHDITNHPDHVQFIHDVKRILGRNSRDGRLEADIKKWNLPFELDDDGNPFCRVGNEQVRACEFVALLLLRAQKIVEDATGKRVTSCVITVPAYFTDSQRRATHDAATIAGMEVLRIMNEPTAVAVAQLREGDNNGKFLIIDAGGGTSDCSKVNLSTSHGKKTFVVEATSGDNALGGHDFLHVLTKLLENKVDTVPYNELMGLCELAKKQHDDPIVIQVRGKPYNITQAKFKTALQPYLQRVGKLIKEALEGDTPKAVILAGGCSCLRPFEDFVDRVLNDTKFLPRRPAAEVVAEGAAIVAKSKNIVVTEVLSRSLGINTQHKDSQRDDVMEVVLKRNTPLPASYTMAFTAIHEKETEIRLYEGEHRKSSENNLLGVFGIAVSAGQEIKVTISATRDAKVHIKAITAQKSEELTVKRRGSELTDSELQTMGQKARQRLASGEVSRVMTRKRKKGRR